MLARDVGKMLRARRLTVSTAESCTGGRLGDALTNVSGSSDYYRGGIISYGNQAKVDLLDVHESSLLMKGAVSDEVARQMAIGVRKKFRSSLGVGITGIAGPTGGTPKKPVGLVYIAVSSERKTICTKNLFKGSRMQVKRQSVDRALEMIKNLLSER